MKNQQPPIDTSNDVAMVKNGLRQPKVSKLIKVPQSYENKKEIKILRSRTKPTFKNETLFKFTVN